MSFDPKPVEDAEELAHPGNPEVNPHEVILELVKGLNSTEAEGLIIRSIKNMAKITGLKSELDSLTFLKPTIIGLDPNLQSHLDSVQAELTALIEEDTKVLDRFQQIVQENKKNVGLSNSAVQNV